MTDAEKVKIAKNALIKAEIGVINVQQLIKVGKLSFAVTILKVTRERLASALRRIE